jgi:NADPH-dependent 2,4-dienoyl-CoA reductase/sulfur reductase-like enzyme
MSLRNIQIELDPSEIRQISRMLIIGGSDAGISAALRIKEIDRDIEVTVMMSDDYPNFSICGLPFYLSGEVTDWRSLAHRSVGEIEGKGIHLLLGHRAEGIDPSTKRVRVVLPTGETRDQPYDRLLIATGAVSARPPIRGLDSSGVFFLREMGDSFVIKTFMDREKPHEAVIIGGGYIGLEMADALTRSGITVTLLEFAPEVLTTIDPALGRIVRGELETQGVRVVTDCLVKAVERKDAQLSLQTASNRMFQADMVIVAAGAKPLTTLAKTAGLALGAGGAIQVDRTMFTGVSDIFAAGDCVETRHRLLERNVYLPLGTTAHKQGRVAGENMIGIRREFEGSLGTQAVKVFDQVAARTGLRDKGAGEAGFEPLTVASAAWDHKIYYPGAREMHIRLTGDRRTGRLLGAQIVGHRDSQVSKRIDILATAIYHSMRVDELCDLDLSYTPPLSAPWDPVQSAAMEWCSALMGNRD